jgi:hypothetical protein
MKYFGTIIEESLENPLCLEGLNIVKRELWSVPSAADYQPKTWTALCFENDDDRLVEVVDLLSWSLKPRWFIDLSGGDKKYVIFRDRVFAYAKGDDATKGQAIRFGRSQGIPDDQLDWPE